jgi:anaerobic ribonucleoside-triphosphate reductase
MVRTISAFRHKGGRKHGKRLFPSVLRCLEASVRLAQLDIEKYGVAKVKFSGTRENPFYSTTKRFTLQAGNFPSIPSELLEIEQKLKGLNSGGSLSIIELEDKEYKPEELMNLTKQLAENQALEFFTYNRIITYCDNCHKSWFGKFHKCPSCGSMGTLTTFDRFAST